MLSSPSYWMFNPSLRYYYYFLIGNFIGIADEHAGLNSFCCTGGAHCLVWLFANYLWGCVVGWYAKICFIVSSYLLFFFILFLVPFPYITLARLSFSLGHLQCERWVVYNLLCFNGPLWYIPIFCVKWISSRLHWVKAGWFTGISHPHVRPGFFCSLLSFFSSYSLS